MVFCSHRIVDVISFNCVLWPTFSNRVIGVMRIAMLQTYLEQKTVMSLIEKSLIAIIDPPITSNVICMCKPVVIFYFLDTSSVRMVEKSYYYR